MNRRIRRRIQCRIHTFTHKCAEVGLTAGGTGVLAKGRRSPGTFRA